MKNETTLGLFAAITCLLLFTGCDTSNGPADNQINPALIGEWHHEESLSLNHPSPDVAVAGIQIAVDKDFNALWVETRTGKLTAIDHETVKEIVSAYNGTMVLRRSGWWGISLDTLSYELSGNTLLLDGQSYTRANLGSVVVEPIESHFTSSISDWPYGPLMAYEVFPYPAAYASRLSDTALFIIAQLSEASLELTIDSFEGPGEYSIPGGELELTRGGADVLYVHMSDSTQPGTIIIDVYDEEANICSGTFSAVLTEYGRSDPQARREQMEGSFSIPIYK